LRIKLFPYLFHDPGCQAPKDGAGLFIKLANDLIGHYPNFIFKNPFFHQLILFFLSLNEQTKRPWDVKKGEIVQGGKEVPGNFLFFLCKFFGMMSKLKKNS